MEEKMLPSLRRGRCRKSKKEEVNKEELAEDFCFICKDGGSLRICDFEDCLKAYHPYCLGKDSTFLESEERWICGWHSCSICRKSSKFRCFCCAYAVCKSCVKIASFVHIRHNKGFCNNCVKLALLIEEDGDIDSDGGRVDFKARDTYEYLFKDYWLIIKDKEGLALKDLQIAYIQFKKGESCYSRSDSDQDFDCDMDGKMDTQNKVGTQPCQLMEGLKEQEILSPKIHSRKCKPKKMEFIGWGSRCLREFLASIGKDTNTPLSDHEVHSIILTYVQENKLTDPEKKKKILCDGRLFSLFRRKSVNRNKVNDLLFSHFAENLEESEEDDLQYNGEENENETARTCKRQKVSSSSTIKHEKKKITPRSCFASVTAENIKLVYLKRSLIEDLRKNPETFVDRVIRSFVRIKSDPKDYFQKNAYQLGQVIGTKKGSGTGSIDEEVIVQVSNMHKGIPIRMLSDDDFCEEEVDDLHQRMKDGLLKKLTVVELENKAKSLHENVMKHWIERELVRLQNLIDRANEKGWRREVGEYLEKRQLLNTPSEQQRLLQEVPEVIAEEIEPEVPPQDLPKAEKAQKVYSPRPTLPMDSTHNNLSKNAASSNSEVRRTNAAAGGDALSVDVSSKADLFTIDVKEVFDGKHADIIAEGLIDVACVPDEMSISPKEERNNNAEATDLEKEIEGGGRETLTMSGLSKTGNGVVIDVTSVPDVMSILAKDEDNDNGEAANEYLSEKVEGGEETLTICRLNKTDHWDSEKSPCAYKHESALRTVKERIYEVDTVNLVLDDDDPETVDLELDDDDPENYIWHYVDPVGNTQGPFPMSKLKQWNENDWFSSDFKIWKTGQTEEDAILLSDALCRIFPDTGREMQILLP